MLALAGAAQPHLVGAVRRLSARCRLGGIPAGAGGPHQTRAVGAGPNGDHRKRTHLSARAWQRRPHPRRGPGLEACALGDGGRAKMLRPVRSDRRIVGRPRGARLHRHSASCRDGGAQPRALLAGPARRTREPQRSADALAHRKQAQHRQSLRPARSRGFGLAGGAVPRTRAFARPLEHRS